MQNTKSKFPIFLHQPDLVYLDSGATALKPQVVIDKEVEYLSRYSANIHRGNYGISLKASDEYDQARQKVANFLGTNAKNIVFTSGATDAINMVARMWEGMIEQKGGVVVTRLEHHSNFVPWQMLCRLKKAKFQIMEFGNEAKLELDYKSVDWKSAQILAITQVSNVTGQVVDIKKIANYARSVNPNIVMLVDGCQAVAHMKVDVKNLGCDYYVFSGHKLYGPTGVGVLYMADEWLNTSIPPKFGGGMIGLVGDGETSWAEPPEKFEAGTPPIAQVIALGVAIDFLLDLGWNNIALYEESLCKYLHEGLSKVENLSTFCHSTSRSVVSFVIKGVHAHDVSEILNRYKVCVRSGHHCTQPLHRCLNVEATTRISFGIYNTREDVDKLLAGLVEVKRIFGI